MDCAEIVKTQREYFRTGDTKRIPFRRSQLGVLKRYLKENKEKLCEAVYQDLRRRHETTHAFEVGLIEIEVDYFLANFESWSKDVMVEKTVVTAMDKPMIVKDPKGVVLIITPWNFPLVMVFLPLVAAIAAGNTVVIKPSEMAPSVAEILEKTMPNYFESKYLAIVNGGVEETTELLKQRFDHILYTGCPPVAKIIMAAAAKHLTPVTLELGGKCPVIVESDADVDLSAKRVAWVKFLNCGQVCLAPDYVMIKKNLLPEIFGPVLPIVLVNDFSDAIRNINDGEKPLAAYLFTRNEQKVNRLLSETSSGGVTINDVMMHLNVDTLPFGGVGSSGMGRYRGKYGFDEFTHEKSVLQRGFFGEQLLASRYPPMTPEKLSMLQRLTGTRISLNFLTILNLPFLVSSLVMAVLMQFLFRK